MNRESFQVFLRCNPDSQRLKKRDGNCIYITDGIGSRPVVEGVIGNSIPRYCCFGNALNLAPRIGST